jgi:hypothetical protein
MWTVIPYLWGCLRILKPGLLFFIWVNEEERASHPFLLNPLWKTHVLVDFIFKQ